MKWFQLRRRRDFFHNAIDNTSPQTYVYDLETAEL